MIRQAKDLDIPVIQALQQAWEDEQTVWGYQANTLEELQAIPAAMLWVVEVDSRLVGYAICQRAPVQERAIAEIDESILEIEELYIQPDYRSQGFGSQLLQRIEAWAVENGYQKLLLYSSVKDLGRILKFYQQQGFSGWNIQMFKPLS